MQIKAEIIEDFQIIRNCGSIDSQPILYPFVRNDNGDLSMDVISPNHGRSFVLYRQNDFEWIIGKGNGLGYSSHSSLITSQYDSDTWGRLSLQQAIRDFDIGNEIRRLGILTNRMEYVVKLPFKVVFNGEEDNAALLQYSVKCPYRLIDYGFIPNQLLMANVCKWHPINELYLESPKYLIAADRLFYNLSLLHRNEILHNAITPQNYTWALELVDFEASHTTNIPFGTKEYQAYIPMLREMEIIQTYEIVNYIAWCLNEPIDYRLVEQLINNYGFILKTSQL